MGMPGNIAWTHLGRPPQDALRAGRQKKHTALKIAAHEFETSATMGAGASVEGDAPKPKFV